MVKKLRNLTTESPAAKPTRVAETAPATPGPRGPALDGGEEAARGNLRSRALPSELAVLDGMIAARLAKAAAENPIVAALCDNPNCAKWAWPFQKSWVGSKCFRCNNNPHIEGGKMREATPDEIKAHAEQEEASRAREERIRFETDQDSRRKIGEIPFENIEAWRAARKADWVGRLKHDAEVAKVWAAQKKGKI